MEGDRVICPAVKHQVKFSNEVYLFNGAVSQGNPGSMGGGGPSVVHHVSIPSHVGGRTTITYPDIIDLINAYRLSNKRRGKATATYTAPFCTPVIEIRTRKLAWRHVLCP